MTQSLTMPKRGAETSHRQSAGLLPGNGHAKMSMKDAWTEGIRKTEKADESSQKKTPLDPELVKLLNSQVDGRADREGILRWARLGLENTDSEHMMEFVQEVFPALMDRLEKLFGPDWPIALAMLAKIKQHRGDKLRSSRPCQEWKKILGHVQNWCDLAERNAGMELRIGMENYSFWTEEKEDQVRYVRDYLGLEGMFRARVSASRPFGIAYEKDGQQLERKEIQMINDTVNRLMRLENFVERCNPSLYEFARAMQYRLNTIVDGSIISEMSNGKIRERRGRKGAEEDR